MHPVLKLSFRAVLVYLLLVNYTAADTRATDENTTLYSSQKVEHVHGRIVGGSNAANNQFPWIVSLYYMDIVTGWTGHNCGGVILNANWILSAAHCFQTAGVYEVIAGNVDRTDLSNSQTQVRVIMQRIIHPQYNPNVIGPHDLALLRLGAPLQYTASVTPIQLPQPNSIPIGPATVAGWGSTLNTTESNSPAHLQFVDVPILDFAQCSFVLAGTLFDNTNICTGPLEGGSGTCGGDSGGPLSQIGEQGLPVLVGIVSWGWFPCAHGLSPTAHARVSHYIDWINSFIHN